MKNLDTTMLKDKASKIWRWLSIVICLALAYFLFRSCQNNRILAYNNEALTTEKTTYKLKNGELVTSVAVLQMSEKDLKDQVLSKDKTLAEMAKQYSKIIAVQKTGIKTTIPKITAPFEEPISIKEVDTVYGELKFERFGAVFNEWYELGYKVTQDTLTIEPFSTWTDINRIDGFKRKWFLGRQSLHSDITLTNPFVEVMETKTIVVPIPRAWHETRLFNMLVGGAIMYGITR